MKQLRLHHLDGLSSFIITNGNVPKIVPWLKASFRWNGQETIEAVARNKDWKTTIPIVIKIEDEIKRRERPTRIAFIPVFNWEGEVVRYTYHTVEIEEW